MEKRQTRKDMTRSEVGDLNDITRFFPKRDLFSVVYFGFLSLLCFYAFFSGAKYLSVLVVAPLFYTFFITSLLLIILGFVCILDEVVDFLGDVSKNLWHIFRIFDLLNNMVERGSKNDKISAIGPMLFGFIILFYASIFYSWVDPANRHEFFNGYSLLILGASCLQIFMASFPFDQLGISWRTLLKKWVEAFFRVVLVSGLISVVVVFLISAFITPRHFDIPTIFFASAYALLALVYFIEWGQKQ